MYPRRDIELVSSHNDLNPGNVLFGSEQAWLVDWEAAFAADRYVDLAALANFFAESESDKEVILQSYFGAATSDVHRARLFLMQQVNRIFYAMVILNFVAAARPETKLTASDIKEAKFERRARRTGPGFQVGNQDPACLRLAEGCCTRLPKLEVSRSSCPDKDLDIGRHTCPLSKPQHSGPHPYVLDLRGKLHEKDLQVSSRHHSKRKPHRAYVVFAGPSRRSSRRRLSP